MMIAPIVVANCCKNWNFDFSDMEDIYKRVLASNLDMKIMYMVPVQLSSTLPVSVPYKL